MYVNIEKMNFLKRLYWITFCISYARSSDVYLFTSISWANLRGNVSFSLTDNDTQVILKVSLEQVGTEITDSIRELNWAIHELPVRYDMPDRCNPTKLGRKIIDLSALLGPLYLPMVNSQTFKTNNLDIIGESSIWGRSILVGVSPTKSACANIQGVGVEKTYEARFFSPVGGSMWFRTWTWETSNKTIGTQLTILSDIFNTFEDEPTSSSHEWNLYITDILDGSSTEFRSSCNFLATHYDFEEQNICQKGQCSYGSFTNKFGKILVSSTRSRISRKFFHSSSKPFIDLSGARQLYIGIEDTRLKNHIYACSRLRLIQPKKASALFSSNGVIGNISIQQSSVFAPSELILNLKNLRGLAGGFHVHEFPVKDPMVPGVSTCGQAIGHYNPFRVDPKTSPPEGTGSHDQYELGDLSGKHGMLLGVESVEATVIDQSLPLFGHRSVVGRSIVIHRGEDGSRWICSNLRLDRPLVRAVTTFRYPLVGEIIFEQERDDPFADTTMIIGPLLYSDGSHNDTSEHQWFISLNIPNKDFYDWQNRCVSAGPHFNPYKISTRDIVYRSCNTDNPERCIVGDLFKRQGPLTVAGSTKTAPKTRMVLTDTNLPLSGPYTILGHSFVIEDRDAPKHRGHRMACTGIYQRFRYKGVVNEWTSSDKLSEVTGHMEFIQETPYDITNSEINIQGLQGTASGYHIHLAPVLYDLSFPCADSSIYGHFNPLNISEKHLPTSTSHDQYEIGDLSGKYGLLDHKNYLISFYNDTNLPLFGMNSILGRSVLIHKKEKAERWFCGNIAWGYAPSEARQVAAIASFHHPNGFAWGYIRFRQLVYNDGSLSETSIEVNLRHPGNNNKNITRGHNWSIFVNPVGVDAAVKFFQTRCVAAGYRWNPFLIQLAFPNDRDYYDKQCTPEYPLRCDAGDISGRLGPIDLGDKRYVFMDSNLPLAGEHSAMGKAVVIHNEKGRVENFACGNILPDEDIVKWANVRKTGRFSVSIFMYDMRKMLNAPEWFLSVDYRSVKDSEDNQCVIFRIYFMGPYARELELDFSRLLAGGILEKPTVQIPGVYPDPKRDKKVPYRACGGFEEDDLNELVAKEQNWWDLTSTHYSLASNIQKSGFVLLTSLLFILLYST